MTTKFQKWICWSLVAIVALRTYFVQELIVAFVLFAIGFLILAVPFFAIYLLVDLFDKAVVRKDMPVQVAARQGNVL